ncbi:MAG: glycosyltransferase family 4 protein [Ignavibacteria bacterium]
MTVVEISECFPTEFKPVTGEFILQHVRALSKYCKVVIIVPLRFIPPRELIFLNPFKTVSGISKWLSSQNKMKNISENNLEIIYLKYASLPRTFFESTDNSVINFFFYNRLKKLLTRIKPDLIYCHWIRPWARLSSELADEFKIPFVIDHHEDIPTLKKIFPDIYKKYLKIFEKTDGIVVHSSINKSELMEEHLKIPGVKVNYLGQNFSAGKEQKKFSSHINNIICVSHLYERRKNIDDLIRAASLIKGKIEFRLTIAGEGVLKNEYMELADSLGLTNEILFTGKKSQDEISSLLDGADIFVLPSYPEAFGIVFIEALAKGLPVITCFGNGGGEELKLLGYPVVMVKPNSPSDLADAILKLLNDKNKMQEMSETGKVIVEKYFSWDKNAKNTYEYLKQLTKQR